MLKTLEEPPPGTVIILVTQNEEQLLPTIRSRCQRIAFGPLDAASMREWWEREGPQVAAPDRAFVEAFAEGSPGMAARCAGRASTPHARSQRNITICSTNLWRRFSCTTPAAASF